MTTRTSTQYRAWDAAGRPERIARPVAELATVLRRYGYTVGVVGNIEHLTHQPPEDHTPYSETGWPMHSPYGWVHALDVMPPGHGSSLPSLAELGQQLHDDRQANDPAARWIKYMNWSPAGAAGQCVHDSWQPLYARRTSTDRGHLHVSCRSDCTTTTLGDGYDPVAAIDSAKSSLQRARRLLMELPTVRRGQIGMPVRRVQALAQLVPANINLLVDGDFGEHTEAAVRRVQDDADLTVDGIVGPYTWAALLGSRW